MRRLPTRSTGAIAAVVVAIVIGIGWSHDRLSSDDDAAASAWGVVQVQVQRKADLVPALEHVVRAAVEHERVLASLEASRAVWAARTKASEVSAARGLGTAIDVAIAAARNAPSLRANREFAGLQYELAGTDNHIALARARYNDAVRDYDTHLHSPAHIVVAWLFRFHPRPIF